MISVIIPTYNEEAGIKKVLNQFSYSRDIEIIVVDGGSSDGTCEIAHKHSVKVFSSLKNRAYQLNKGVKEAQGDIFLFLHADSILEDGALGEIKDCIGKGFIGGCFRQNIKSPKAIYRFIESSGNIRAKCFKVFYGDQAIFVRGDIFRKIGGFDKIDLFDDVLFSKKLKKEGKTIVLNKKVYTSARRWEKQGIIRTTFINWVLSLGFILGISPNILKKAYCDIREERF